MTNNFLMQRQALLIPPEMKESRVLLVGLGMLGSWIAQSLVRTCDRVIGMDFDTVGMENVGTQAYTPSSVGNLKAEALGFQLMGLPFTSIPMAFEGTETKASLGLDSGRPVVVISASDSFAARRTVAEWARQNADLFVDTRAHGTVGTVVTVPPVYAGGYDEEIKALEAGPREPPACGAEGTAFTGMWVASQVTNSIYRFFRGLPVPYKVVRDTGMDEQIHLEMSPGK